MNKCPLAGCPVGVDGGSVVSRLASAYAPITLALDATNIYFTDIGDGSNTNGGVFKCALGGCASATPVAQGILAPVRTAINATSVIFLDGSTDVLECPLSGCGTSPYVLATESMLRPFDVVADDVNAYWGRNDGTLVRCAVNGGCNRNPVTVVKGPPSPAPMAIDSVAVYWGTLTGDIVKVAK